MNTGQDKSAYWVPQGDDNNRRSSDMGIRRRSGDDGAVAVEAALVIPLLLIIVFGIIEFSMLLRDHVSLTSAARSGARTASAQATIAISNPTSMAITAVAAVSRESTAMPMSSVQEVWVYQANDKGFPGSAGQTLLVCGTNCIRFTGWNASTHLFATHTGTWTTGVNACAGETMTAVGVYIKATHASLTHLFATSVGMNERAVMQFEPVPRFNSSGAVACK